MLDEGRIEEARRLDIRDEARRLGLDLAKGGRAFFRPGGRGPAGGSPSGSIYRRDGIWRWHDFSEGVGGDVIDLVQHYAGLSLAEALDSLLGSSRVALPPVEYSEPEERREVAYRDRVRACSAFYEALPPLGDAARSWLLETRAISSETISRFGLRQSDEQTAPAAMGAAIEAVGVETVIALGLGKPSKHSDGLWCPMGWGCWIAIPYRAGRDLGHLQFRRFHRDESKPAKGPKYLHINGEVPYPFNVDALDGGQVMVVEGAFDAMAQEQREIRAIGVPGTGWLAQGGRAERLVKRAEALCVAFDADEAGWKAQKAVEALLWRAGAPQVDRAVWPPGFEGDWCDFYREGRTLHAIVSAPRPAEDAPLEGPPAPERPAAEVAMLSWGQVQAEGLDRLVGEATGQTSRPGLLTGLADLDQWIRLTDGSYNVIAGRPSDGKSHLLLSMAYRMAATHGYRIGICSLEMSRYQVSERIAKAAAHVGRDLPRDTGALVQSVEFARRDGAALPITIACLDDRSEASVLRCLDAFAEQGCDAVMVDYVQYVKCRGNGIEERTANASKALKAWAKSTNTPMVAAAMLRRPENERAAAKRPTMDMIRGSGEIEQGADVVVLVHYPWRHDPETYPEVSRDLYIDKNRNGLVSPHPISIAHASPFGFFGDGDYRGDMRRAGVKI